MANNENCVNPFRIKSLDDYRRNFPPFEGVFAPPAKQQDDASLNLSTLSSSVLSISGRAALDAHNHFIARYGIDGQESLDQPSASFNGVTVTAQDDKLAAWDANAVFKGLEEVHSTTDQSSSEIFDEDFFQSDGVEALRTPERYKMDALRSTPTLRQRGLNEQLGGANSSSFDVNSSMASSAVESETKAMLRLALSAAAGHHANTSSSSSSAGSHHGPSLSNIDASSPWSSRLRQSPRHPYDLYASMIDIGDTSVPIDASFLNQSDISTSSSDHHVPGALSPQERPPRQPKWDSLLVSPVRRSKNHAIRLTQRRALDEQDGASSFTLQSDVVIDNRSHTSPPRNTTFFPPILGSPGDTLSPIRPSKTDDASSDCQSTPTIENNRHSRVHPSSSSSSGLSKSSNRSKSSPNSTFDDYDRRRYRTVVPSRVFMSETSDFPLEQDSFSPRMASPSD